MGDLNEGLPGLASRSGTGELVVLVGIDVPKAMHSRVGERRSDDQRSARSAGRDLVKDQREVHVRSPTDLDPSDVSPRCVVCSPQVDAVIAGYQSEPIRPSDVERLSGYRNISSQNDNLVL